MGGTIDTRLERGEYISRICDEPKRRPYLVRDRHNFDGPYPGLDEFDPPTYRVIGAEDD